MSGQVSSIRTTKTNNSFSNDAATGQMSETQGAEQLAALVWNFVSTAGSLVEEIDTEVRAMLASLGEPLDHVATC